MSAYEGNQDPDYVTCTADGCEGGQVECTCDSKCCGGYRACLACCGDAMVCPDCKLQDCECDEA